MSRSDERPLEPPGDDEITTDVDTGWVATIRAELAGRDGATTAANNNAGATAEGEGSDSGASDWRDAEPAWDPEATVGASNGLIERIRREIDGTSPGPALPPPAPVVPALAEPAPTPVVTVPVPADVPPVSRGFDLVGADEAASTTVRWEPRQRLTTAAPVNDTAIIAPTTAQGLDRTRVAIAIVVAVALVAIVWLLVGSLGGDDAPAPAGSVPASGAVNSSDGTDTTGTTIVATDEDG